jgi:hypothetical protein
MPDTTLPPPGRHVPEIYQLFTPIMAQQARFPSIVTQVIHDTGRFRCYGYRSALRNVYILTENNIVIMLTSNRRFVELAYTIEPK